MKTSLKIAIKLTLVSVILFCGIYMLFVWGFAQILPNKGKTNLNLIGQKFSSQIYFWPRPSAVDYNASASGGSNLGPSNTEYLQVVQDRIDTILKNHSYLTTKDIPSEWVTCSGSGLDPDLSLEAIRLQVKRVARARNIENKIIEDLVNEYTKTSIIGLKTINVLQLNQSLDKILN